MRKSKTETAQTRQRIVEEAAKAFRKQGIEATGVAEIMAAAGLTHGGFYRHFASKEELVSEAMSGTPKNFLKASNEAAARGAEAMLAVFQEYASEPYRDDIEHGCPLAANGSELARADLKTRHRSTVSFGKVVANLAHYVHPQPGEDATDTALSLMTQMVGALTVSRIVDDPALSERILAAARRRIASLIDLERAPPAPALDPAG